MTDAEGAADAGAPPAMLAPQRPRDIALLITHFAARSGGSLTLPAAEATQSLDGGRATVPPPAIPEEPMTERGSSLTTTDPRHPSFDLSFREFRDVILPRFGGQSDHAAITDICIFNSNSIGLT